MPVHPTFPSGARIAYRRENGVLLEYDVQQGRESETLRAIELDQLFDQISQNEAAQLRCGVYQSMESESRPAGPVSIWVVPFRSGLAAVRRFITWFIEVVTGGDGDGKECGR